jgi:hypothetical protein
VVVNDGKPFEALGATVRYYEFEDTVEIVVKNKSKLLYEYMYLSKPPMEEIYNTVRILEWQLAQALNPPIEVTQAVLEAMEKVPEAKYLVQECSGLGRADKYPLEYYTDGTKSRWYYKSKEDYKDDRNYGDSHPFDDYIQADDCPLALQVLLGFTTEGVPKDD